MTHADEVALWEVCAGQWRRLKPRWNTVNLPEADWEDIRSKAVVRVFQRAERYDPCKGSPETWAGVIMYRSIINSLRAIIPSRESHKWRTNLHCAYPIRTMVKQTGRWGEEVMVVEPDMVDDAAASPRFTTRREDFSKWLNADQRIVLKERERGLTIRDIWRLRFKHEKYYRVNKHWHDIQQKWTDYNQ